MTHYRADKLVAIRCAAAGCRARIPCWTCRKLPPGWSVRHEPDGTARHYCPRHRDAAFALTEGRKP